MCAQPARQQRDNRAQALNANVVAREAEALEARVRADRAAELRHGSLWRACAAERLRRLHLHLQSLGKRSIIMYYNYQ